MQAITEIYGRSIVPAVDSLVHPDGWMFASRLIAGDSFGDWHCPFRIPSANWPGEVQLAVRIEVTGHTLQRRAGEYWVRVRIVFIGDGEPDTNHAGWMRVD